MTNKANAKTAAQEGLDELMQVETEEQVGNTAAPETAAPANTTSAAEYDADDNEELETLGESRVELFFIHKVGKKGLGDNQVVIQEDQEFTGVYEGSFTSGKFESRTHKLLVKGGEYDGKIIGLPACGKLDKAFQFVSQGTRAMVRYNGSATIKTGKWAGSDAYLYDVAVPKSLSAAIKAGTVGAPKYQIKSSN